MKKLKNIDYKAFFIDHAEKIGLVVFSLFVLLALARTSWSRYPQSPDGLKAKIAEANNRIDAPTNKWPQTKSEQFKVVDFTGKARDIFQGIDTARYELSTPMYWPLYRKKEKAKEPEFLAPQFLISDPGEASLSMSTMPAVPVEAEMAATDAATAPADSDYRPPVGQTGPGGTTGRPPVPGTTMTPPPTATPSGTMGARGTSGASARGMRYIAVRGIVPIKEQTEKAMRALNLSYADASAAIEYFDFTLQRQMAVDGPDPWAGKWETVDIQRAIDVLSECTDFDPDPVPADLKDAVFTMELPARLIKYWGDDATHPKIKNFELSKEEIAREEKLFQRLREEAEKLEIPNTGPVKGGLVSAQNDMRRTAKDVLNNKRQESTTIMRDIQTTMSEAGVRMGAADLQSRLTASGRLYLFRYFDFDVQPGMAYRYRLKLTLANPNYQRPYEEVENADFTRDPTRETPYSNISNPSVVPQSMHYYLKDVERDPQLDERSRKPVASLAMFEWDAKLGTMLSDTLKIFSVGQFISDKAKKTLVLDPATPSFEEKPVPLVTEDVLVDASADIELPLDLHPELDLKPERGKKEAKLGVMPEALVVTALGELNELDPVSELSDENKLKKRVADERRNYEYLRNAPRDDEASNPNNPFQRLTGPAPAANSATTSTGPATRSSRKKNGPVATAPAGRGRGRRGGT